MNDAPFFTHAEWRVRPGKEAEFVRSWQDLAAVFAALPARPLWGTLLQSLTDPTLFYSFGPWASEADIAAMRETPAARDAIARVVALCERATPGAYRQVRHIDLGKSVP